MEEQETEEVPDAGKDLPLKRDMHGLRESSVGTRVPPVLTKINFFSMLNSHRKNMHNPGPRPS